MNTEKVSIDCVWKKVPIMGPCSSTHSKKGGKPWSFLLWQPDGAESRVRTVHIHPADAPPTMLLESGVLPARMRAFKCKIKQDMTECLIYVTTAWVSISLVWDLRVSHDAPVS